MRPVKLIVSAFGPYAGEQVFDFRLLKDRNLFLIHGPTGAGKTSILDAICFALYGETSGAERNPKQMRSDHADPSCLTEVTFDFSLGRELYRVYRSPDQERPRKKGGGTTKEKAQAMLWQRTGCADDAAEGRLIATQPKRVTEAVEQLLGFKSHQFRQVIVLPQGQFRTLLLAGSGDREKILETLFQTETYRRIEEALKETAKQQSEQIKACRQRCQMILEQADAPSADALSERRQQLEAQLTVITAQLEQHRQRDKEAHERLAQGQQVVERLKEHAAAQAALAALLEKQDQFTTKQTELALARKAATLVEAEAALRQRTSEAQQAERQLAQAQTALHQAEQNMQRAQQALKEEQARDKEREQATRQLAQFDQWLDHIKALEAARQSQAAAHVEAARATAQRQQAQQAIEQCQRTLDEKQKSRESLQSVALRLEALRSGLAEATQKLEQRQQLERIRQDLSLARGRYQQLQQQRQQVATTLSQQRAALAESEAIWFQAQAAILAQQLVAGQPCPVCGSTEHPRPARAEHPLPSEATIKQQRRKLEQLQQEHDELQQKEAAEQRAVGQFESAERVIAEQLGQLSHADVTVLEAQARQAAADVACAEQAAREMSALEQEVQQLKQQQPLLQQQFDEADKAAQEANARLRETQAIVAERETLLPEQWRDRRALLQARSGVERALAQLKASLEKAQQAASQADQQWAACRAALQAAEQSAARAHEQARRQQQEFAERLGAAGFLDEAAYESAKRTAQQMESLERELADFQARLQAASERAQRAQEAAHGLVEPDLAALQQQADAAKQALERALMERTRCMTQLEQTDRWLNALAAAQAELTSLEEYYSVIGHIADVANGRNPHGITFQRFVLGALLDDVLIQATERLKLMSRGRFHLQRAAQRADLRTAGGLDLEIYDAYTGTQRTVSTLSGGESFLASLSLALGLADVVQSYAGGIHLDTIFVDEGFGSLDAETLDFAIRALTDLQAGGRLVGIISHVPELRERIDARLEIIAGRAGSTARFVL
ncbi:MAG: SMC family ATPase [Acidobacteriota bacterium]|nr:SMC family ATPase [Blastocatellia bacterium]MDW8241384.1 SMC family ATPase [Acidobacteriota bacterium]